MGGVPRWRVGWGVLLLGLACWGGLPSMESTRPNSPCVRPIVWRDGGAETLLCGARAIRAAAGRCQLPAHVPVGSRLTVTRSASRCLAVMTRLPAKARLRLGLGLDINADSARALEAVPGIGPRTASRIVDGRPYGTRRELLRVRGIGLKRLGDWSRYLRARAPVEAWPADPRDASTLRGLSGSRPSFGR
jgi:hypothetical protein